MAGINRILKNELNALVSLRAFFLDEYDKMPEGTLETYTVNKRVYIRIQYSDNTKKRALSMKEKSDIALAQKLRRKRFLKSALKIIDNNIAVLEKAAKKYIEFDPKAISDSLSLAYRIPPGQEKEIDTFFVPRPSSDYVFRSKSEQIIALVLESNGLEIMYEKEEFINRKAYRPDFTFRDPETGRLVYYEHFGLADHPGYYEKIIEKLLDYWHEGIRLGENLIITFETKEKPLTAGQVQAALDTFFGNKKKN